MEFSVELKPLTLFGPGEGKGYPLQYSCGRIPRQKNLADFSPCGHKESDTTERLSTTLLFGIADIGKVINIKRFSICLVSTYFS